MSKREFKFEMIVNVGKVARLNRIAASEFVYIGYGGETKFWYDDVEKIYYREYTCNGSSSWAWAGDWVGIK